MKRWDLADDGYGNLIPVPDEPHIVWTDRELHAEWVRRRRITMRSAMQTLRYRDTYTPIPLRRFTLREIRLELKRIRADVAPMPAGFWSKGGAYGYVMSAWAEHDWSIL